MSAMSAAQLGAASQLATSTTLIPSSGAFIRYNTVSAISSSASGCCVPSNIDET
jgi:hypothetical protein